MMAHRRHGTGWLPSSTQLFATVLVLSACGVAFSLTSQTTSASANKDAQVIFVVGRIVQCRAPQQAMNPGTAAAAQAVAQGRRTPARADLSFATAGSTIAVVRAGCSLQLTDLRKPGREWVAGPYTQAQELQISGVDMLDCLVHDAQQQQGGSTSEPPAYAFLLRSTTTGPDHAFAQLEAVEYAQLAAQTDSNSTHALLESWLGGVSLPESCLLTALHSNHQRNSAGAGVIQDVAQLSTSRQLRQDGTASDAAAAAAANATTNATTPAVAASSTAATEQRTAESGSSSSNSSSIATTDSGMNSLNGTGSSSMMNGTGAPEVLAQDQLLTDAANSTQAAAVTSSAPSNTTGALARVVCSLQPQTGPCRASLKRWAFDVASGACKEFVYGGCRSNTNNFVSQQACEVTCSAAMGVSVSPLPAVDVPPPSGPMSVTVDDPRVLAGSSSPAAASSSAGQGRSWAEQLARVVLAGVMGFVMVLLL